MSRYTGRTGVSPRGWQAQARADDGASLTELLVTMMILGVVVLATATLVIGTRETNAQNVARLDQVQEARTGVESMARTLRTAVMPSQLVASCAGCTADAFVLGRDYEVQFYANIENPRNSVGPSRVTYAVPASGPDAGNLVQTIQVPDSPVPTNSGYQYCNAESPGAPASCRDRLTRAVVARHVQVVPGQPLFAYYNDVPGSARMNQTSGAPLTVGQLASVLAIEVRLTVQEPGNAQAQPTTYIQRIMLPNAQAVIRQSEDT